MTTVQEDIEASQQNLVVFSNDLPFSIDSKTQIRIPKDHQPEAGKFSRANPVEFTLS